jgi:hypothetical protein
MTYTLTYALSKIRIETAVETHFHNAQLSASNRLKQEAVLMRGTEIMRTASRHAHHLKIVIPGSEPLKIIMSRQTRE